MLTFFNLPHTPWVKNHPHFHINSRISVIFYTTFMKFYDFVAEELLHVLTKNDMFLCINKQVNKQQKWSLTLPVLRGCEYTRTAKEEHFCALYHGCGDAHGFTVVFLHAVHRGCGYTHTTLFVDINHVFLIPFLASVIPAFVGRPRCFSVPLVLGPVYVTQL